MKQVSLIGSGNMAHNLGMALLRAGYSMNEIYSPHFERAEALAEKINATPLKRMEDLDSKVDYIIICVKDDVIAQVVQQLPATNAVVLHTSGTWSLEHFDEKFSKFGVLYPLQSFSQNHLVDFFNIPIFIEGNNENTISEIFSLANSISDEVNYLTSAKRKKIHVAAVFANNFTNHLYSIASTILAEEHLSFDVLRPLIQSGTERIMNHQPQQIQTGPAKRGDLKTIQSHLELLEGHADYRALYELISSSITKMHGTKPL